MGGQGSSARICDPQVPFVFLVVTVFSIGIVFLAKSVVIRFLLDDGKIGIGFASDRTSQTSGGVSGKSVPLCLRHWLTTAFVLGWISGGMSVRGDQNAGILGPLGCTINGSFL